MDCSNYPIGKLPYPALYQDYLAGNKKLTPFFESEGFSVSDFEKAADRFEFKGDREDTVSLLNSFNKRFDANEFTLQQIEKLKDDDSMVVVTGQQLTVFGGPLFTIYKTLTAIVYARRLQKELNRPVIPVFWLADEDHDIAEASELGIPGDKDFINTSLEVPDDFNFPAGRYNPGDAVKDLIDRVKNEFPDTDFTDQLWSAISKIYHGESTIRKSFGKWLLKLFSKEGLILAGSDEPGIKKAFTSLIKKITASHSDIYDALETQSNELESAGYSRQANVQPSSIFYVDEKHGRIKLDVENNQWSSDRGHNWSNDELIAHFEEYPERFSPNVFLRPIIQDHLLPVAGVILGPGETAYFAQMKKVYPLFDIRMPIVIPRFTVTIIESAISRNLERLPFEFHEYSARIEDLESDYITKTEKQDVDALFSEWKNKTSEISDQFKKEIEKIDSTLESSAGKATALYFTELDKLKGKVYRSLKQQDQIQLDRIRKVKDALYPDGGLQERQVAFIWYMNRYGMDIWNKMCTLLIDEESDSHKLIRL